MGSVLLGETVEKTFQIENVSSFPIKFNLKRQLSGVNNFNGSKAFYCIPQEGTIESQKSVQVTVSFMPDTLSEKFFEVIEVDVPNQLSTNSFF